MPWWETNGIITVIFVGLVVFETRMYRVCMPWIVLVIESKRTHRLLFIFYLPKILIALFDSLDVLPALQHANYILFLL